MTTEKKDDMLKMDYRMLGDSGLKVSVLGFGMMTFDSVDQAVELLRAAREGGVNFFDNAEFYGEPPGDAETCFGKALKILQKEDPKLWRRSDLVITTKLFFGPNPTQTKNSFDAPFGVNEFGTSRKHLMEGTKASLKRLQLDYVDVIYAHRYDPLTPILEVVRAFTNIINSGLAFYWGTSSWPPSKIIEAYWIAEKHDLIAPIVEQPIYNMFTREVLENDYLDIFESPYSIGTTIWSPLDGGILTGKYNNGIPKDSRLHDDNRLSRFFKRYSNEKKIEKCKELKKLCDEKKWSMVSLAIGWCLKNKNVTCVLLGASKKSQIVGNLQALKVARELDKEMMEKLDKLLENKPERNPHLYRTYRTCPSTIGKL